MKMFTKGLNPETQLLIAMGAAVAANCKPCLEKLVGLAQDNGLDAIQMRGAVFIGQFVKDQPAAHMKELADQLVGSKLSSRDDSPSCGCNASETPPIQCPVT